jgi:hypothetical protein
LEQPRGPTFQINLKRRLLILGKGVHFDPVEFPAIEEGLGPNIPLFAWAGAFICEELDMIYVHVGQNFTLNAGKFYINLSFWARYREGDYDE